MCMLFFCQTQENKSCQIVCHESFTYLIRERLPHSQNTLETRNNGRLGKCGEASKATQFGDTFHEEKVVNI